MAKSDLVLRTVKGVPLTHAENDGNFDRLMYYTGDWVAGTYSAWEVVRYLNVTWLAVADTSDTPSQSSPDWVALGPQAVGGYGGLRVDIGKNYGTITATWRALDLWDTVTPPPINCVINGDGTFEFSQDGWWALYFSMGVSHDESNGSRTLGLRVFNVNDAVGGDVTQFGVARNQAVSNWTINPWIKVESADVGKTFRLEVQRFNGQDFNSWTATDMEFRLQRIA
jgi:hypothetical protein